MTRPSPLDDPATARFAWRRFRRLLWRMLGASLAVAGLVLAALYHQYGPISIHLYVASGLGVIATMMTVDKLLEKVGVTPTVLVAEGSPRKEVANNMYRPLNDADKAKIKEILDTAYERFTQVVADGRKKVLTPEEVKAVATGDIYNTKQAIANKLIDGEGYLEDVLKQAKSMAKIAGEPRVTVINPARSFNPMSLLMGQSNALSEGILEDGEKMRAYLQELRAPRVEYLWEPGM